MSTAHNKSRKERREAIQEQVSEHMQRTAHVRQYVASLAPITRQILLETLYQQNLNEIQASKQSG